MLACIPFTMILYIAFRMYFDDQRFIKTDSFEVETVSSTGLLIPFETYRELGNKTRFFIFVNGNANTPIASHNVMNHQRWFTVCFSDGKPFVSVPYIIHTFPYLRSPYHSHEAVSGMDIFDYKISSELGEKWFLAYSGESLVFSNEFISVSVKPKGGQWLKELEKNGAPVTLKSAV